MSPVSARLPISTDTRGLMGGRSTAVQAAPRTKPRRAPLEAAETVSSPATWRRRLPRTEGVTVSVTDSPHGDQSERTAATVASDIPIHRAEEPII